MKKVIIILVLHFILIHVNAQFSEKNAIYLAGQVAIGNYLDVNLNLVYVYDEKYSFQAGYSNDIRKARSQPADYDSGLAKIIVLGLSDYILDEMDSYQILVGKIYKLDDFGKVRLNLAVGIAYTTISEPTNWEPVSDPWIGPNYTYDIEDHSTVSFIVNPKIEFPFSRIFGISISPMLLINKDRTFIGIGAGSMIGLLRKKIK